MTRRPVAWIVAVVLFGEALFFAAFNWFLGVVVDRQKMSLAGLDPEVMARASKIGGIVFGLYFALCGLVALLVAVRDRQPAGLGRVLLISVAVVHGLLAAFAWGPIGPAVFLGLLVVLALIVLLLVSYDRAPRTPGRSGPGDGGGDAPVTPGPAPTTP
ncbi:hypothetical protein AB0465_19685 [Streptomyces griseoviridis]|uniref:Integral membrane protein n=1 Tax=Streptomyces griseoviridis TaxID=45398 RepID=A0A3Q9KVA4_STRGD|nr:hypothetical protein [Streptomyces griseoviridis]AZS85405.1 hypothetical protein ELQ87_14685 [Streptomyces griseoviridis]QCN87742.1 hypothetical protein DDJ31_24610 [Streptomyces griseoviridis]